MRRRFHTLDVFTETKLAGNPLAVVLDCDGLSTETMQAIAAEFNLSETVFVLPPDDPVNTARLRIFTPKAELPFAGHPTVGAGVLIGLLRAPEMARGAGVVVALEENIGIVKVEVRQQQGRAARGIFGLPRLPEKLPRDRSDLAEIASALNLTIDDIETSGCHAADFSAGVPYALVPVRSVEALARARPLANAAFDAAFGGDRPVAPYLYASLGENRWRTRMFAPHLGLAEDPATGSAAAAFAGAAMAFGEPDDGVHQHILEQGVEMGRPSEIILTLTVAGGALREATIGGAAVIVAEGTMEI
ncbi:MAG: PhzF family phenazine biosynthesis protein [Beijerinckiaceae bacterium]